MIEILQKKRFPLTAKEVEIKISEEEDVSTNKTTTTDKKEKKVTHVRVSLEQMIIHVFKLFKQQLKKKRKKFPKNKKFRFKLCCDGREITK